VSSFNEQIIGMLGGPDALGRVRNETARFVREQIARHAVATVACWCAVIVLIVVTAALVLLIGYGAYRGWLAGW